MSGKLLDKYRDYARVHVDFGAIPLKGRNREIQGEFMDERSERVSDPSLKTAQQRSERGLVRWQFQSRSNTH